MRMAHVKAILSGSTDYKNVQAHVSGIILMSLEQKAAVYDAMQRVEYAKKSSSEVRESRNSCQRQRTGASRHEDHTI
jgi:hypothetical protein